MPPSTRPPPVLQRTSRAFMTQMLELATSDTPPLSYPDLTHKGHRWIGKHGTYLVRVEEGNTVGDTYWCCNSCGALYGATSTGASKRHLNTKHRFFEKEEDAPKQPVKRTIAQMLVEQGQTERPAKRLVPTTGDSQLEAVPPPATSEPETATTSQPRTYKDSFLAWMVETEMPLSAVQSPSFVALYECMCGLTPDPVGNKAQCLEAIEIYTRQFRARRLAREDDYETFKEDAMQDAGRTDLYGEEEDALFLEWTMRKLQKERNSQRQAAEVKC